MKACIGDTARNQMEKLMPIPRVKTLREALGRLDELFKIKTEGHAFPRIDFEELTAEIKLLEIQGSVLTEQSFQNILVASRLVNDLIYFFNKQEDLFPMLCAEMEQVYFTDDLIKPIERVFTARGEVKDDASPALSSIRKEIVSLRRKIARLFNKEMKRFIDKGFLGDVKEAYLQNRRVLAVQSSHKRKIAGAVQGHSKTGNLTYIEPQAVVSLNHELEMVHDDERKEVRRILSELTDEIRGHIHLVKAYQQILTSFDFLQAKARVAIDLNCSMPSLVDGRELELYRAYHPLLWMKNKAESKPTKPQNLKLTAKSRMLVISGPNAGGKSITLKTVGLLQLMLQCGLMVPVHVNSRMGFFQHILTDIGDNQSIENQLSTYSYRLKRMKHFLDTATEKSLLLLDEFGTGSDPELGGALAEVFFEELYGKGSFGIITTHYSNIKLKASELKQAMNGSMLFDKDSLAPLFQLDIGQPGSSFTFEVATINGISPKLIASAKSRLDSKKVKMDQLIADLQKEKSRIQTLTNKQQKAELAAKQAEHNFKVKLDKLEERDAAQTKLIEANNTLLHRGKKLESFIKQIEPKGKNKEALEEVKKYLLVERGKQLDIAKAKELKEAEARKRNKKPKVRPNQHLIKVGSTVKLINGKERGTVLEMDKDYATVAFGVFKTRVKLNQLKFVK